MASWEAVRRHVEQRYRVHDASPDHLRLVFSTGPRRDQVVLVSRHRLGTGPAEEWLLIESPVGRIPEGRLRDVLLEAATAVCGGVALHGDTVTLRHGVPLAHLDAEELDRPLRLIATTADRLEKAFGG